MSEVEDQPLTNEPSHDAEGGVTAAAKNVVYADDEDDTTLDKSTEKAVGYDEEDFDLDKYPVREVTIKLPCFKETMSFNPIVSAFGIICLWGLSMWCMIDPAGSLETLKSWRSGVTLQYTWLFIGTRAMFFFFLLYVVYKYGHLKLGPKNEPPEFTTGNYFMMIFAAGVAVGLFVYGVAEPLSHQQYHYFANAGYRTQDEVDQFAINMTVNNWAWSAWACYLMVAVSMALAGHRFALPMTFRSCFYPIFGDYTWGWIGDILDGFTIVTTVAGVCTSLGIGAINIAAGLQFLGWIDEGISESSLSSIQILTIWCITAVATASVISGLHVGVQLLSQFAFGLGMLLLFLVFTMDNTKFLMNLFVQEIGYCLQWSLLQLTFWTDAFGQLREGEGRAVDGLAAHESWMDWWGIFYQAWWISWAAFVGMFVARISRGRTVAEVITYSLVVPVTYCILWFSVWGGVGLRQARQALELQKIGETYFNDTEHYLHPGSTVCYDVPQTQYTTFNGTTIFENRLMGVTPVCLKDTDEKAAFNVLYSFSYPNDYDGPGYGPALSVLFLVALSIYFATSSDSGSLIVDHLASNGRMKHHWFQRFFWAVTEGAVATALISAGGKDALQAVQAASVICGLPYAVLLLYLIESIYVFCKHSVDHPDATEFVRSSSPPSSLLSSSSTTSTTQQQSEFSMPMYGGIFNFFEYVFSAGDVNMKRVEKHMHLPTEVQISEFVKGVFVPFLSLHQVLNAAYPKNKCNNTLSAGVYMFCYLLWISFMITVRQSSGMRAWGWAAFFCNGVLLTAIRSGFRHRYNIRSNEFGDFMSSLFVWPQVLTQMRIHCEELSLPEDSEK